MISRRHKSIPVVILMSCILLLAIAVRVPATTDPWFTNGQMVQIYESLLAFHNEGLYAPDRQQVVQEVIDAYLTRHDPYARYFNAAEYRSYKDSLTPEYGGIQMDIDHLPSGEIECRPFPGGAAEKAGIKTGDQLLAVDTVVLRAREDIFIIGTKIRGPVGTDIRLVVRSSENDEPRTVTVTRMPTHYYSLTSGNIGSHQSYRIHRFTTETPDELRQVVNTADKTVPLILDLRGNSGGDLESAIESAALFLPAGAEIVTLKTTREVTARHSREENPALFSSLIVLQDARTASAAEVFLAALVQNKMAISIGRKSFGKGIAQKFVPLTDGAALLISYAKLLPPGKVAYHQKGLLPTIEVGTADNSTQEDLLYQHKLDVILAHSEGNT